MTPAALVQLYAEYAGCALCGDAIRAEIAAERFLRAWDALDAAEQRDVWAALEAARYVRPAAEVST